ncbi:MAG: bifunctional phosphopantothenoylcysteine decarboxylase/phosphopantothenate--cysteine ligase CoaBC [Desulfobacteraceae bacterium]|nr:MAG: bifunctional phosphopantothenoylcysteine decarboxylase/phosphopantothenate--cysteine ligase CoaBC [Desulfobacteraceae bacterium]
MDNVLEGKNIILGVSGGIAAYKSLELLRLFTKAGARVRVIMTRNARSFVGPASFEALSGRSVCTDLFERSDDAGIRHIEWAAGADLVVVAPATANIIGKIANGLADDALSTFLLAVTCPVMICPSMNTHMYENRAVQHNIARLKEIGYRVVTPSAGALACGTTGPGRLPEPESILETAIWELTPKDLTGKRVLVTAGPTWEPIDPVRFITNPSTGKMGFAVARAAACRGADVLLISGPSALEDPLNVRVLRVQTAEEMGDAVIKHFPAFDIVVKTAAVSDWAPVERFDQKIKKTKEDRMLHLRPTMDILKEIGRRKKNQILVGFAAETENLKENAQRKLTEKNLDLLLGNPIGNPDSGFAADTNTATLFYKDGTVEPLPTMKKSALAHLLLDRIIQRL